MERFKVDRRRVALTIGFAAVTAIGPALSIWELVSTGTIDFDAASEGSRQLPVWLLYAISWPVFVHFFVWMIRAAKYVPLKAGFAIEGGTLRIHGVELERRNIIDITTQRLGIFGHPIERVTVSTPSAEFSLVPDFYVGGLEAFRAWADLAIPILDQRAG